MSNVLIGIIGVILFIGLALAGALFLGPRFQQTAINTEAARIVNNLKQVANAADMMATNEDRTIMEFDQDLLVSSGYLKSLPENHLAGVSTGVYSYQVSGTQAALGGPRGIPAEYVVFLLYTQNPADNPRMQRLCEAIAKQTGQGTPSTSGSLGCMPSGSEYLAFLKL